ncbi:MAG: PD40 domain-containing protein [Acidobacteria bacterium]|nr:PD40 domain-containing protein [Acidobacteriota bacterium]
MNTPKQRLREGAPILWVKFGFTLLALITLCGWVAPSTLGQAREVKAELFGVGVLSVGEVYRGSFTPDGRAFYFFKKVTPEREDYRLFVSHLRAGKWSEPERVNLGGDYSDLYPAISKDGKRMVFSSFRPAPGDTSPKPNAHLWYVDRQGNGWGEPVFMAAANKLGHYHSWVEFGPDKAIYFRRTTPDWQSNEALITRWNGKEYAPPVPFAEAMRWKHWRSDLRIAGASPGPDGRVLFLDVATRNPQTGRGASDIWVSLKQGHDWAEPKPLGAGINSDGYDVFPFFSPDGKDLYFVRDFAAFYRISLRDALKSVQ